MNGQYIESACLHCSDRKTFIYSSDSDAAWLRELDDIRPAYGKIISKESGSSIFFLQPCSSGIILIVANMIPNCYGDNLSAYLHLPFGIKIVGEELEDIACEVLSALQKNRKDAISSCLARIAAKEYPVETIGSFKRGVAVSDFAYREVDAQHSFASILSCVFQPYYAAYKYVVLVQEGQTIINRDKFDNLTTKGIRDYVGEAEAERIKAVRSLVKELEGSKIQKEGKKNGKKKPSSSGISNSGENKITRKGILGFAPSLIKAVCVIVIIALTRFGIKSLFEHSSNEQTDTVAMDDTIYVTDTVAMDTIDVQEDSKENRNNGNTNLFDPSEESSKPVKTTDKNDRNTGTPSKSSRASSNTSLSQVNDVEYVAQQASRRILDYDDISGLSRSELRIVRNWIFARYGYAFKSPELQRYFGRKSWYTPMHSDVSSRLTSIERQNVLFIKQYE